MQRKRSGKGLTVQTYLYRRCDIAPGSVGSAGNMCASILNEFPSSYMKIKDKKVEKKEK